MLHDAGEQDVVEIEGQPFGENRHHAGSFDNLPVTKVEVVAGDAVDLVVLIEQPYDSAGCQCGQLFRHDVRIHLLVAHGHQFGRGHDRVSEQLPAVA